MPVLQPLVFDGPIDPNIPVVQAEMFDAEAGLPVAESPAQAAPPGKRKKRPDLFGQNQSAATPVQRAPAKAAAATPRTTTTASGQQTHSVTTDHDLHRHFAQGGWGELCSQFLVEHGVPALPAGTVARMAACARGHDVLPAPEIAAADMAALNARERFTARQLDDTAAEQTARIMHDIYVVEDFPSTAMAAGLRTYLTEGEARRMAGCSQACSSESPVVNNNYYLAEQLQVWSLTGADGEVHVLLNPRPSAEFAAAAVLNSWVERTQPPIATSLAELSAITSQIARDAGSAAMAAAAREREAEIEAAVAADPATAAAASRVAAETAAAETAAAETATAETAEALLRSQIPPSGEGLKAAALGCDASALKINAETHAMLVKSVERGLSWGGHVYAPIKDWTGVQMKARWPAGKKAWTVARTELLQAYFVLEMVRKGKGGGLLGRDGNPVKTYQVGADGLPASDAQLDLYVQIGKSVAGVKTDTERDWGARVRMFVDEV